MEPSNRPSFVSIDTSFYDKYDKSAQQFSFKRVRLSYICDNAIKFQILVRNLKKSLYFTGNFDSSMYSI